MKVELLNQKKKKQHTAVPKKLNARKQRFLQQQRSRRCCVGWWRQMSGTKKGGEELHSAVWQQVIICQRRASTCPHQKRQARSRAMRSVYNWGQKPPQMRLSVDHDVVCFRPRLGLRSPGLQQRKHKYYWEF